MFLYWIVNEILGPSVRQAFVKDEEVKAEVQWKCSKCHEDATVTEEGFGLRTCVCVGGAVIKK